LIEGIRESRDILSNCADAVQSEPIFNED
jgi:hypothetical protein